MDIFAQLVEKIIEEQEHIIGPIALERARNVRGLTIDWPKKDIKFTGDKTAIIEKLIQQYKILFGQASVEACKEAVVTIIIKLPENQRPPSLK